MSIEAETVGLKINGALLAISQQADLANFDAALRGVALSDSPILIQSNTNYQAILVDRLHALSRRAAMPVRTCHSAEEAQSLIDQISNETDEGTVGTWALHGVSSWPRKLQQNLNELLELLDEGRLHGRIKHERIPRIVVLEEESAKEVNFVPDLHRRLSFFHVAAVKQKKESAHAKK